MMSLRNGMLAAVGAVAGYGIPWALGQVYRLVRGREGIGMGDFKMLAMVGSFLGWRGVLFSIGVGSILGTLVGVPWALVQRKGLKVALPFGTFLGVAALWDLFGGRRLLGTYLGMEW